MKEVFTNEKQESKMKRKFNQSINQSIKVVYCIRQINSTW